MAVCHAKPSGQSVSSKLKQIFSGSGSLEKCMKTSRYLRQVKASQQFLWLELVFIGENKIKNAELKNCSTSSHFCASVAAFRHALYYRVFCCELVITSVVVKFSLLVCVSLKVCSPI